MWSEPREWKLKKLKDTKEGICPVKTCGNIDCGCLLPVSAKTCNFCGYVFPKTETQLADGVMKEVGPKAPTHLIGRRISDLTIKELIELEASKKYKPSFIWRVVRSFGEDAIDEYGSLRGHSRGWAYRQKQDLQNSTYTNYLIR
jgi:hypothetical protein